MSGSENLLRLEKVHSHYGMIEALKGVSLEVNRGEIVSLIGANGAGKSTLLMTVCGDPQASSGSVHYKEQEITAIPSHTIMRSGISVVPEGRRIFSGLTVIENLQMGAFFADREQIEADLEEMFRLFPRLRERQNQRGGTLSGGEQQMLAIGRALMARPKLLLLDEPSLGLAPLVIAQIFEIIQRIRDEGVTIFLVEQNAHRALQISDRGYVLENGEIVLQGLGSELLINDEVKRAYLGG
ncbi:MAG: ABC transporter ATP-binding protein [Gammaproteobacteria bacterium]|nr:ABC transporter ATP-binding protein [Gammaproteobacteria bacterium]